MSFFDRQGIPEALVRTVKLKAVITLKWPAWMTRRKVTKGDVSFESIGDDVFEDDILTLRNYSFILANADNTTFEMHGLVQLATRQ
jgi:hypothetical protein